MKWEDVEKELIRLLGKNYFNYPKCVEWNIKIMKYIDKRRNTQALEKVKNAN